MEPKLIRMEILGIMKLSTWFTRTTGSPIRTLSDCECRNYGRAHCFACTISPEYEEKEQPPTSNTPKPRWWSRWLQTHLTPADIRFLSGLPEKKPFYRRQRREWKPARQNY